MQLGFFLELQLFLEIRSLWKVFQKLFNLYFYFDFIVSLQTWQMLDWTNFSILLQNNHHPMLWLIWWDDGSSWQYTTDEYSKRIRLRISNNGWKMSCESTTAFSFHHEGGREREYNATDWNKYVRVTKHWIELIASIIEWCMLYMYQTIFAFKVHYIPL